MAVNADRIRSELPDGTLIRVTKLGREYPATRVDTGADVTRLVRRHIRKRAFEAEEGLRVVWTKTGGVQFRKHDAEEIEREFAAMSPVHATGTAVTAAPEAAEAEGAEEMSHADLVAFLERSYSMKPDDLFLSEVRWKYAMRTVLRGGNLMFTGPAGCGKTLACQTVARTFPDRPYFYFNLGASQDPRGMLIGNTHYSPEAGTFVAEALFAKAIQTPNAVILLDETSRAHDDAANILMTVLDRNQRYLRIDERPDTPTIKVAPGVVFLATANIGNEYTGTRVMDRAFLDRFAVIEMEPLNAEEEKSLLGRLYPEIDERWTTALAEIAEATRADVRSDDPRLSTIISTRATVEMAGLIHDGFTLGEAAEVCVYPFFDAAGGAESERVFVKALVQKYLPTEYDEKETPWGENAEDGDGLNKVPW